MTLSRRALLITTSIMAAGYLNAANAADKVIVGLDGSYPPFASVGADGQLQGFDVDLVKSICSAQDLECELQNVPYDGIFAALETGKISVIAAGVNITDERKAKYLLPGPYLKSPMSFMTAASSELDGSAVSMEGKAVGTVASSVFEKYLASDAAPKVDVRAYDSMDAAVLDLDAGRIEAVFGELVQLQPAYVQAKPDAYKLVGKPVVSPEFSGQGKGLIVAKENSDLAQSLNEGITKIVSDGTHAELTKKWFGVEVSAN